MFIALLVSVISILLVGIYVVFTKGKKSIHLIFLGLISCMLLWNSGVLLDYIYRQYHSHSSFIIICSFAISVNCVSVFLYLMSLAFKNNGVEFNYKIKCLFIIPVISSILAFTNQYHHLLFKNTDNLASLEYGPYFYLVHTPYSYILSILWAFNIITYILKNGGFFSKQAFLLNVGLLLPLVANILATSKIIDSYFTNISFSFTAIFYFIAIMKFNFLKLTPLALSTIFDNIEDCYIVLNDELKIIDYNKSAMDNFGNLYSTQRGEEFYEVLNRNEKLKELIPLLKNNINTVKKNNNKLETSISLELNAEQRHFSMQVLPIIHKTKISGIIIALKDVTAYKNAIYSLKMTQNQLLNQEKLLSIGQLIGGISHNTKSSIMSISGAFEAINGLVKEYKDSITEESVTVEDHYEIADEMNNWLLKAKDQLRSINTVISAVREQSLKTNYVANNNFTISEFLEKVYLLMEFELKKYKCTLNINNKIAQKITLQGEVSNLIQAINNIIKNSIYEYNNISGKIDLTLEISNAKVILSIKDYAKGLSADAQAKIFKEMYTSKGSGGTGLGLYIAYAAITGNLKGDMWYETKPNKGTTFFIALPIESISDLKENFNNQEITIDSDNHQQDSLEPNPLESNFVETRL